MLIKKILKYYFLVVLVILSIILFFAYKPQLLLNDLNIYLSNIILKKIDFDKIEGNSVNGFKLKNLSIVENQDTLFYTEFIYVNAITEGTVKFNEH